MRRFLVPGLAFEGQTLSLEGTDFHHLVHVLRAQAGQRFEAVDGNGHTAQLEVIQVQGDQLLAQVINLAPEEVDPVDMSFYTTLTKGAGFEWTLEKLSELGVHQITPLLTERSIPRLDAAASAKKKARWQKLACETAKKVGRSRVMAVQDVMQLPDIPPVPTGVLGILAYERASQMLQAVVPPVLPQLHAAQCVVRCVVGPEGGFSEREVRLLMDRGYVSIGLGSGILRADTANVFLASVLRAHFEGIRHARHVSETRF